MRQKRFDPLVLVTNIAKDVIKEVSKCSVPTVLKASVGGGVVGIPAGPKGIVIGATGAAIGACVNEILQTE